MVVRNSRRLFMAFVVSALTQASVAFGQSNIEFVEKVDLFTDLDESFVMVLADQQRPLGRSNALFWRCAGTEAFDLFLATDDYISNRDRVSVIYRFGSFPANVGAWVPSASGEAVFAPDYQGVFFTREAVEVDSIAFGVTKYTGERLTYTFPVVGLRNQLELLGCSDVMFSAPLLMSHLTIMPISRVYEAVRFMGLREGPLMEGVDRIDTRDLSIVFEEDESGTVMRFRGFDTILHQEVIANVRREEQMFVRSERRPGFYPIAEGAAERVIEGLRMPLDFDFTLLDIDLTVAPGEAGRYFFRAFAYVHFKTQATASKELLYAYAEGIDRGSEALSLLVGTDVLSRSDQGSTWGCRSTDYGAVEVLVTSGAQKETLGHFTLCITDAIGFQ